MQRREVMTMAGAVVLLGGGRALAQATARPAVTEAKVVRIYSTADGGSRAEVLVISPDAEPIAVTGMTAGAYRGSGATAPDWHTAPRKQFAINMSGELEVELGDGSRQRIASDLVFLDDTSGRGHVTRALGPITNVFIQVRDDFDVVAWASGR